MSASARIVTLASLLLWLSALPLGANLYHWTDERGVRHYSNTRPPDGSQAAVLMEEIPYDPESDTARRAREEALLQEREAAELKDRLEEAERKAEEARREAEEAKRKADRLEKELEAKEDEPSYGIYYYPRPHRPHRPPGWRPPGHRPPGGKPPHGRPRPEHYGTPPTKPWYPPRNTPSPGPSN